MEKIRSFQVDHRKLDRGMYISRIDGDVVTYDLRFKKPNTGDVIDDVTVHTIEHMLATYTRNSGIADEVVYFGPMGCRTGFYFLVRDTVSPERAKEEIVSAIKQTLEYECPVFGASEIECGNYRELDLESAKAALREYLPAAENAVIMNYDEVNAL